MLMISPLAPAMEVLKQRAGDRELCSFRGLVLACCGSDTHMSRSRVLHDRGYVGKVKVDDSVAVDKVGNALDTAAENIVCLSECVCECDPCLGELLQSFVGDDDKRIDSVTEDLYTFFSRIHSSSAFKGKGLGNDTDSEDSHVTRQLCHDGSGSSSGSSAHTCGDEHHVSALESGTDLFLAFLGGSCTVFGIAAGTHSFCGLFADGYLFGGCRTHESLLFGINSNELDVLDVGFYHTIDGIGPAAPPTPTTFILTLLS